VATLRLISTRTLPHTEAHPPERPCSTADLRTCLSLKQNAGVKRTGRANKAASGDDAADAPQNTLSQTRNCLQPLRVEPVLLLASLTILPPFGLARLLGPSGYEFRAGGLGLVLPGLVLMVLAFDQAYALSRQRPSISHYAQ